ncbi:hypothetical protein LTR27_008577 [Elasticomyces elasticus]|nr:hypothetical protein LTR27_008577 [Elasticomyces elasticus]
MALTTLLPATIARVWTGDKVNVNNFLGTGRVPMLSDLPCELSESITLSPTKSCSPVHSSIKVETKSIDPPIVFYARLSRSTSEGNVFGDSALYVGVAEVMPSKHEPDVKSLVSSKNPNQYVLSWRRSDGHWFLLLDPRDPSIANVPPLSRYGNLHYKMFFASARIFKGPDATTVVSEARVQGIVFGQPSREMRVIEWEDKEIDEDLFQLMTDALMKPRAPDWMPRTTTPQETLAMLRSPKASPDAWDHPTNMNIIVVRQFCHRLAMGGFQYRFKSPATAKDFLDALGQLRLSSSVSLIAKLNTMARSKEWVESFDKTAKLGERSPGCVIRELPLLFSSPTPLSSLQNTTTDTSELHTSIVNITVDIDGESQHFDVLFFGRIERNGVPTRHFVAKDVSSEKYLAIFMSEGGKADGEVEQSVGAAKAPVDSLDSETEQSVVGEHERSSVEDGVLSSGPPVGVSATVVEKAHAEEEDDDEEDDSEEEDESENLRYHPDSEFSAYPAAKWMRVAILKGSFNDQYWLTPEKESECIATFSRVPREVATSSLP